jgi:hypothetical protein
LLKCREPAISETSRAEIVISAPCAVLRRRSGLANAGTSRDNSKDKKPKPHGATSPNAACHAFAPVVCRSAPARMAPRWGGVFSMDDHRHAIANVLDQTEEEKFLIFTVPEEDLERVADGTAWAHGLGTDQYLRSDDLRFGATGQQRRGFAA